MSKLVDRLARIQIHNGVNFVEAGEPSVWVDYLPAVSRYEFGGAVARYRKDGTIYRIKGKFTNGPGEKGITPAVNKAKAAVEARFGPQDWVRTPFGSTWVPRDAYDRVMAKLHAAEKEAEAQAAADREKLNALPLSERVAVTLAHSIARRSSPLGRDLTPVQYWERMTGKAREEMLDTATEVIDVVAADLRAGETVTHVREAATPVEPDGIILADCSCGAVYSIRAGGDESAELDAEHARHIARWEQGEK